MGIFFKQEKRSQRWGAEPPVPAYPGGPGDFRLGSVADGALQVPTVWACVSLLANAVSMLPLETFRRTADVPAPIAAPLLVESPSAGFTQSEWLHMLMVSMLLRGNAYARISARDSYLRPTQLDLLNPDSVTVRQDPVSGRVTYVVNRVDVTDEMWHLPGFRMPGSAVGISPIDMMAATLHIDVSSRQFAMDFFNGGGIPKAVLTSDQVLNQDQARTIKDRLLAATRSREPLVLPLGIKYQGISVSPEESQFLLTQQANVAQIARYFSVPAGLVGGSEGGSMTYTNVEQRGLDFLTFGVQPWLNRVEQAFFVLLPQPTFVKFNTDALLRTDAETQAKVDNQRIAGKIQVGSEIRQRMGLKPFTPEQQVEADMVPLTVTPLGGAKALPGLASPPGNEAPVPLDDSQKDEV